MIITVWIISLVLLVASIVFVYKMLKTSREYLPERHFLFRLFSSRSHTGYEVNHSLSLLLSKIESLEKSNAQYEVQIATLQAQVQEGVVLSAASIQQEFENPAGIPAAHGEEDEEDWEELYYQENEKKVQLENELDQALQQLEAAAQMPAPDGDMEKELHALRDDLQAARLLADGQAREIELLKKQVEAAEEKERVLQKLLDKESRFTLYYQKIDAENTRLRQQLAEIKKEQPQPTTTRQEQGGHAERTKEFLHHLERYEAEKRKKLSELNARMASNKMFVID